LVESGHIAQNFYLLSVATNLSCCAIGGYFDDALNKLLDIDGVNETVLYALAIGEKKNIDKGKKEA
jgi:nitroreductase